jgi:hypothetical protein
MYEQRLRRVRRGKPKQWAEYSSSHPHHLRWLLSLEWALSWVAWALGNWALIEVLDYLGSFSILFAVILYFSGSGDRLKQKHYQAWQVVNTAQGKGGNGGRIEALQELNADHVSLIGIDASEAFLQGIRLPNASLSRCDLHASDLRQSLFRKARLDFCNLQDANFRNADFSEAHLENADLSGADLNGTNLRGVNLAGARLDGADLRQSDFRDVAWQQINGVRRANLWGIRNASPDFVRFALSHGAVSVDADSW